MKFKMKHSWSGVSNPKYWYLYTRPLYREFWYSFFAIHSIKSKHNGRVSGDLNISKSPSLLQDWNCHPESRFQLLNLTWTSTPNANGGCNLKQALIHNFVPICINFCKLRAGLMVLNMWIIHASAFSLCEVIARNLLAKWKPFFLHPWGDQS